MAATITHTSVQQAALCYAHLLLCKFVIDGRNAPKEVVLLLPYQVNPYNLCLCHNNLNFVQIYQIIIIWNNLVVEKLARGQNKSGQISRPQSFVDKMPTTAKKSSEKPQNRPQKPPFARYSTLNVTFAVQTPFKASSNVTRM